MAARTASATTSRRARDRRLMLEAKCGATSRFARSGSARYASAIGSSSLERMMHPPFQMRAISGRFRPYSYSLEASRSMAMPWA